MRTSIVDRVLALTKLGFSNPGEFFERIGFIVETRLDHFYTARDSYKPDDMESMIGHLEGELQFDIASEVGSETAMQIEQLLRDTKVQLQTDAPQHFASDYAFGRLCFALARAVKPEVIVETGVSLGFSSTFLLAALDENGSGKLHSVDLPPLGDNSDEYTGSAIPKDLKKNWTLHRGTVRQMLPQVIKQQTGSISLAVFDSLHTYKTMKFELDTLSKYGKGSALVLVDDIQDNRAFAEWVSSPSVVFFRAVKKLENKSLFGIAIVDL